MAAEQDMTEDYLEDEEVFRRNAYLLIEKMVELSNRTREDTSMLVDEILHSIFFLGHIIFPPCSLKSLLDDDDEIYEHLNDRYPEPFIRYSSQLPRRSPLSCVLDMIVHLIQQENEAGIIVQIKALTRKLMDKTKSKILFSTTLCISRTSSSVRYYGVSMSTFGRPAGKIMVAASCLCSTWDDYVADAVMTYYPSKEKKPYFDGTFQLPSNVTCQAVNISSGERMNPCRSCGNLFGLHTESTQKWAYGNCAEVESVSKLLKNEKQVRDQVQPRSNLFTEEGRQRAKECVLKDLKNLLKNVGFEWDNNFYTPQRAKTIVSTTTEEVDG
ncbi:uncharacterized protein LOC121656283 isoform X1 [Melanotaenia boesemani]|uniref:uncharacterized protein LOC121656283 isoform X1 n=1 Tax=Melanotaenia boesemani TaxID=1250792 RepID=UPI001C05AE5F|nr:uncharacterized protein LOC121656283 isoform X1 [Melanotaenia boesemani]XP_041867243.1 uncharacterized protein LOC121656283 isoform X1 [Melanotaenia boesemani]XP_041867244.1 uncharacterized protein LOC121656283 isoform X1 [Melanotaenia boesemani]XP_041867245.1 uncharacterized protein LOC121656283 isoform X1 [Melanotaenia boesemani]XP_041867246.1 uncharacterized protein LOC121656283 isoform X1 [Melanotaenia boesemani]XP_041867247.1 uncharacterized protein LOC121656283 isoform X1 [Melanotaeni